MPAYRFCRTDDIGLLVDALNRCWAPYFPDEPPMTPVAFKRSIRDLQVWCSSCMVAFSGSEPIGVLIGAKRPSGTLVHKIAVHPDHVRQGHGRHLLESLGSKLAILGPPRIVAEVPDTLAAACALFSASGYVQEALLTDYVFERTENEVRQGAGKLVIPFTVDDLAANGLVGEGDPPTCWERSIETLAARKEDIAGLAVADERIEASVLYLRGKSLDLTWCPPAPSLEPAGSVPRQVKRFPLEPAAGFEVTRESGLTSKREGVQIVLLKSFVDDGGAGLRLLLSRLCAQGIATLRFPKVHPAETSQSCLEALGFRPVGAHRLYAATARSA